MRPARALLLAALLLPFAAAVAPTPASWGAHDTRLAINDLAMGGPTVAAALTAPQGFVAADDLAIYDVDGGFAKGRPYPSSGATPAPPGTEPSASLGRNLTAVSADGRTVASVGNNSAASALPDQLAPRLRLQVQRLQADERWSNASTETNATVDLATGNPLRLHLSADGSRVLVAYQTATEFVVAAYAANGASLTSQYTYREPGGVLHDVAVTPDLETAAVAGSMPQPGNLTHGVVHIVPYATGAPVQSHFDRSANGTAFRSVATTSDGSRVVAGDSSGRLHVFAGGGSAQPLPLPGGGAPVARLLVSEDGNRIAAVSGASLTLLDGTRAPPGVIYNVTLAAAPTDVAMNRTGGLLAVASGGQVRGYGDVDGTQLWSIAATGPHVAMDADGSRIAYLPTPTSVAVANVTRAIQLEHLAGGDASGTKAVRPQGTAVFPMRVKNDGAAVERVSFQAPRDLDVTVTFDPPVVAVNPDATATVNVSVATGPLFSGTRGFNVTAVSLTSGARDDATVAVTLQDEPDVRFILNDTSDVAMKAGESRTVLLGVLNGGASDAAVGIRSTQSVSQGAQWSVVVDPSSLTLAPNSVTTVRVTVAAPADAKDGTANALRFQLEGANTSDEVTVVFRVNPTLGVDVTAAGRVKFVEPGEVAYYNVTITNTGSLPRRFEAFYEVQPQGGKSWAVDMDTTPFRLEPAGVRTVEVRIFAPQDAVANQDRVSVLVRARTFPEQVNETLAEGNVTLFANAVPKTVTTTTPGDGTNPIPFSPLLPLLAAGALALLRRRRDA